MKKVLLLLALVFSATLSLHATEAGVADQAFKKILLTLQHRDYEGYLAAANVNPDNANAGITKTQFDVFSAQMKTNLDHGYQVVPAGEHDNHGYEVFLYHLIFKNGSRGVVATLTMKDGQVAGIYLQ